MDKTFLAMGPTAEFRTVFSVFYAQQENGITAFKKQNTTGECVLFDPHLLWLFLQFSSQPFIQSSDCTSRFFLVS
jgi:hypothetical protein